ncbi:choline/ethanolamine kinase-like protein [Leptotrombidium deliense]|uniref:Choline/ethanolamine kinase-like protein n=1 Tax=Leptotrombidium deliense TaxID=299467 RepID=A0A443S1S1_9ACAR|nr:choline/ethanolamine kinase-like protein [Leptotrombidium deliense]
MDKEEEKKRISKLCKDFLTDAWSEVSLEDIDCKELLSGYGNQTFHCSINHCKSLSKYEQTEYKDVIIRVYGSLLFGQKDRIKLNIEAGESLTMHILSLYGIAPKVLGVFAGGVIVEYIHNKVATAEDLKDPDLCAAVVRKIAKLHTMEVPIKRRPILLEKIDEIVRSTFIVQLVEEYENSKQALIKKYGDPINWK